MQRVVAILSMLHELPHSNSATRHFRHAPVLHWTLQRLAMSRQIDAVAILCWDDQLEAVAPVAQDADAHVLSKNPRIVLPPVDAVTAARRWADGWRGGPLATCHFDLGFYAPWTGEIVQRLAADAAVIVDPSAGLVDPRITDDLVARATEQPSLDLVFTQAPPGLAGAVLTTGFVKSLAEAATHPGRLLTYLPDRPARDPVTGIGCVSIPTPVARSTRNFCLDSDRQVQRMTQATVQLNGQLISSNAEELVHRLNWTSDVDSMPRDVVMELNTQRSTSPIFWPGRHCEITRRPMPVDAADHIFRQLGRSDDIRVTLAGVGDPLLHPDLPRILDCAISAGIRAIHVQTDLLPPREQVIDDVVQRAIDIVSVHLPATTPQTYAAVMGVDGLGRALENLKRLVQRRHSLGAGVPVIAPVFTKCQVNLSEMEVWYDQWLRALGSAVIVGPSAFGGIVPECGVGDMAPPQRCACRRLESRMTILADGRVVSCEEDVVGQQTLGNALEQDIGELWTNAVNPLRRAHAAAQWANFSPCDGCREWHRP